MSQTVTVSCHAACFRLEFFKSVLNFGKCKAKVIDFFIYRLLIISEF